ncbi:PREDICTED: N-acetyltransferase 9-like protein [Branchiostoma belcheri]|uniref:N-acetyltransferase 9-like protein n=1 Tax=Branchiostoma belcheri TaxID=7741 RepID=A0A6P5AF28_BRABE|nr:PREDICTED: N-acetyltransferase 9-like protein [Branchiostoma belcheri]
MKINEKTLLQGSRIVLVPYKKHHVPKYHGWMQSPELQELTASEPLTLEQEYDMQHSWWQDENKCTFIVLDKNSWQSAERTEIDSMIGDVNLFFTNQECPTEAEIEIMIAEPSSRRKGAGREALTTMMAYGVQELGVTEYMAKIGYSNHGSLSLFHKLGYTEVSRSDVFQEVTLHLPISDDVRTKLEQETSHISKHTYEGHGGSR